MSNYNGRINIKTPNTSNINAKTNAEIPPILAFST